MSVHYIELAPTAFPQLGAGAIVYKGDETTQGGAQAIDFAQSPRKGEGQPFYTISLKDVPFQQVGQSFLRYLARSFLVP